MKDKIKQILNDLNDKLKNNAELQLANLEELRQKFLSKKGEVANLMQSLKNIPNEEKPILGKLINELKEEITLKLQNKKQELEDAELLKVLETEKIDITLPGYEFHTGSIHPLNAVIEQVEDLFIGLGFMVAEGPEVEKDLYNFEMMNMEKDHPARAMQDSFYIDQETLLRTHTSPVQARMMLENKGNPLRIICPGKVYRRDNDDATHSHQFMQIEGLVIDKDISFANLKETLLTLVQNLFGKDREIRLRPSYFPFTEPSVEVDVSYVKKDGSKGYIEVLGAGLVHPNVLKMAGYNPEEFSGFAFGIGVERIAILKYHIDDIRHFYTNDIRFLSQFKGVK
ncbi:Phenylalanyl-tRNA synthetase, alpha chain [Alteracholeplasma palmae J233]|uniref:Phenylalanine--tRNA ligase alpha subunit n=1 Tax=Alteracholeplasma palmae (strain ATCC 49389 / J233) TaxID=1318466 RepID=U4KRA1_ALTPJ|nr:phenylalanine--tRNA ligase subunit alpha [Alteracholeplasma palmae]CCV63981.1 Phenylalanyl-tRNA synthetase, alpha chain [Alteracholeplasma palmae J233]